MKVEEAYDELRIKEKKMHIRLAQLLSYFTSVVICRTVSGFRRSLPRVGPQPYLGF